MAFAAPELGDGVTVPIQSEPCQTVIDRFDRCIRRTCPIRILDPEQEPAAIAVFLVMFGEQPVEQRRAGAANMQKSGRRGGKTGNDGHEISLKTTPGKRGAESIYHKYLARAA